MRKSALLLVCLLCIFKTIDAQNVGIGLTNPTKGKLEVYGTNSGGNTSGIFGTDGAGISLQRNVPAIGFNEYHFNFNKYMTNGYAAIQLFDHVNGAMHFDLYASGIAGNNVPSGLRALTLHPNGNVGVRGGGSQASLSVARGSGFGGTAMFSGTTNISHFNYDVAENTYIRGGKNGSDLFLNDIVGGRVMVGQNLGSTRMGINTENPTYTLDIVQAGNTGLRLINPTWNYSAWEMVCDLYSSAEGSTALTLKYNGNIKGWFKPTDGSYFQYSDGRLKKNVETISPVLKKVLQLNPVVYEMKNDNKANEKSYGFIAQDVGKLFPEMVHVMSDSSKNYGLNELNALNYSSLSVIAVKAIQEQQAIIESQKATIDDLKARLERIEKKLRNNP